jgi:hypothetical protein
MPFLARPIQKNIGSSINLFRFRHARMGLYHILKAATGYHHKLQLIAFKTKISCVEDFGWNELG